MKNKPFRQILKMFRPGLRPSLASKEFHKFLCWKFGEAWRHNPTQSGQGLTPEQIKKLQIPETKIEGQVLEWEQHFKQKPDFSDDDRRMFNGLLADYPEWRKRETSRRRAESARKKAEAQVEAKAIADRIKEEKKLARRKKPHLTFLADPQKVSDRQSLEDHLAP